MLVDRRGEIHLFTLNAAGTAGRPMPERRLDIWHAKTEGGRSRWQEYARPCSATPRSWKFDSDPSDIGEALLLAPEEEKHLVRGDRAEAGITAGQGAQHISPTAYRSGARA